MPRPFVWTARRSLTAAIVAAVVVPAAVHAQLNVLGNRYDDARTGANLQETTLTAANVNVNRFGKIMSYPVDGPVYAQPLLMSGVMIGGQPRNLLFVATMNDRIYAFDTDSSSTTPVWYQTFINPPYITTVPITDITAPDLNIVGNIGIQGTPVIDAAAGTLYLVARTKESGNYVQRLHALDAASGDERPGSPIEITAAAPGTSPDASGGLIRFDPKINVQRAGLALVNGVLLVAWASHEDLAPSHGWIMAFNSSTLAPLGTFAVTPDAYFGGIWQGGRAPAVDAAGNIYFATGNGLWDGNRNYGDSLLKFRASRSGGLLLLDYFTPSNEVELSNMDHDLSGSGFTLLPGTNLLAGGGKEGVLYVIDSTWLGGKVANDTQIVQKLNTNGGHIMGGVVYWNSPGAGPMVYNWAEDDTLKAYRLSGGRLVTTPYAQGEVVSPGHPGGSLTLSANGSTPGTGIVWASMPTNQDNIHGLAAGILRAFNAETLEQIWTSDTNAGRDRLGTLMKFVPPVVANGKVYLPNQDKAVAVYGLLPSGFSVAASPGVRAIAPGSSGTFNVTVGATGGFAGTVALAASGNPSGTTVSFSPASVSGSGTSTITVNVPAGTPASSFSITVSGTSGGDTRSANPVVVNVSSSSSAGLGAIGINFVGGSPVTMAASETAGVVSKGNWNNAAGASSSTPLALVDEGGAATGATATWSASAIWQTPITDGAGNRRMMSGYLDTTNISTTVVTVTGLAQRAYDVYVYADGDNRTYARTAEYKISGPGVTTTATRLTDAANTNFSGTFTRANGSNGNYVKFSFTGTEFAIAAVPTNPSTTRRAPINGIQIVPAAAAAPARAIGVDFVGNSTTTMGASETAGVVSTANWNSAAGTSRSTALPLVDETGAATSATMTWSANGAWSTTITDAAGNRRMMRGYLDTSNTSTTTVTVAGLQSGSYDVYVYVDGDNKSYNRTAEYSISGSGITTQTVQLIDAASTNFSSTFTQASGSKGNYVKFHITATGFTLKATAVSGDNTTLRAPINGIQIVPTAN